MLQRHVLICSGKMNPVKMHSAETNNNSKVIDITQLKMPRRPTLGTEISRKWFGSNEQQLGERKRVTAEFPCKGHNQICRQRQNNPKWDNQTT